MTPGYKVIGSTVNASSRRQAIRSAIRVTCFAEPRHARCRLIALLIALDNDRDMYRRKLDVAAQLFKKVERGIYSHTRAVDAWLYVVDSAAKMYIKEFSNERDDWPNWPRIFSPATRELVAEELAARWERNVKAGRPEEV